MKRILTYFVSIFLFNTAIAAVLSMYMGPFWFEFIYSQCIGLSVLSVIASVLHYIQPGIMRWVVFCIALPAGVALGMTLSFAITGVGSWHDPSAGDTMVIGVFFGLIGGIALLLAERIGMEVKQRKLIKAESEKREIEAHLRLLQAQIEPHFLFNTLANASSLIETDPATARKLLERLNDWLRVALVRARSNAATLGDELDMLENYLKILKIRFGERLRWRMEAADAARHAAFPPMLLQPLVENAVRHGIEPKIGGGEVVIVASIDGMTLHVEVRDSGMGLKEQGGAGAGLANVRARLAALFGESGKLALKNRAEGGTTASIRLPV